MQSKETIKDLSDQIKSSLKGKDLVTCDQDLLVSIDGPEYTVSGVSNPRMNYDYRTQFILRIPKAKIYGSTQAEYRRNPGLVEHDTKTYVSVMIDDWAKLVHDGIDWKHAGPSKFKMVIADRYSQKEAKYVK